MPAPAPSKPANVATAAPQGVAPESATATTTAGAPAQFLTLLSEMIGTASQPALPIPVSGVTAPPLALAQTQTQPLTPSVPVTATPSATGAPATTGTKGKTAPTPTLADPAAADPALPDLNARESSGGDKKDDTKSDDTATEGVGVLPLLPLLQLPVQLSQTSYEGGSGSSGGDNPTDVPSASGALPDVAKAIADAVADLANQAGGATNSKDPSTAMSNSLVERAASASAADDPSAAAGAPSSSTSISNSHAAHLHGLATAANAMQDADTPPTRELRSPVGSQAWQQELGDQLTFMARNGTDSASLRMSPDHLGPVEVRISMSDGQASVWFGAANADTRSALDQSLPRLREMFASQGMMLADAGVFKDAPRQQGKNAASFTHNSRPGNESTETAAISRVSLARLGILDTYA